MRNVRLNTNPAGSMKFSTILILVVLFYAGFATVKILSANIMRGQIKTDIIDQMGYLRGPDFTVSGGEDVIRNTLKKHGVLDEDYEDENYEDNYDYENDEKAMGSTDPKDYRGHGITVNLNDKKSVITFHLRYKYTTDFIFFKKEKVYDVQGEVQNYN